MRCTVGSSYPNVTGSNAAHGQGVERSYHLHWSFILLIYCVYAESGNMLIMTYAYARASGDGNIIAKYVCRNCSWIVRKLIDCHGVIVSVIDFLGGLSVKYNTLHS
jgi:Domain of unknown function (DUF4965)